MTSPAPNAPLRDTPDARLRAAGPESTAGWFRRAPVERGTIPAAAGIWTASAIMHATGVAGIWPALAGLGLAAAAYRHASRKQRRHRKREQMKRNHGADTAGVVMTAAAWMAAAVQLGPLAGPWHALSLAWAGLTFGGYWWLRKHEAVAHARHWRHRKMSWHGEAHALGIADSHMTDHEQTRLGESFELDTTGTGQLASAIVSGSLAERYAERRMLPPSRVRVTKGRIAGRVRVSIRDRDPWADAVPHPLLTPGAADPTLPVPCSVLDPARIGFDPETGDPFAIPVYDRDAGGKRTLVMGTSRQAGKTVLLNCARERVTACTDALIININLSKAIEDRAWAPACHLTAIGPDQGRRAQRIMTLLVRITGTRPKLRDTAVFEPSPARPAIVLFIDEVDAASPWIRDQLQYVTSKGGSEGISVYIAGQRGTADWVGGGNIRAMLDGFLVGAVSRQGEQVHAAGNLGLEMPDMSSYGEGAKGVWAYAPLGGSPATGRTFLFKEPPDIRTVAHARAWHQPDLEPELAAELGDPYRDLLASDVFAAWARTPEGAAARPGNAPAPPPGPVPAAPAGEPVPPPPEPEEAPPHMDDLEQAYAADPADIPDDPGDRADRLGHMRARNAETRRSLGETDRLEEALPDVDPAVLAEGSAVRWKQAVEQDPIPAGARDRILAMLAGEGGTTVRAVAAALGVPRNRAHTWLTGLRMEGLARVEGKGRAGHWVPVTPPGGDSE